MNLAQNYGTAARPALAIIGVHTASEAYPNTRHRLADLHEAFEVTVVNSPLWLEVAGAIRTARRPWRALRAHLTVISRYLAGPRPSRVYVPYPAVFVLLFWSILPRRMRPRWVVADAFISLYDTVVNDRKLMGPRTWRARLLHWVERRAYATADCVVVDTALNAVFYARLFRVPADRFVPIALSTNETDYRYCAYAPGEGPCRVLFVGTLVPLHGVETILAAAALLAANPSIRFSIIGDGQEADKVRHALEYSPGNVDWDPGWKSPTELATAIAEADICLGVFGSGEKAQRVCPYKLYAYSAIGRTVITCDTQWLRIASEAFGTQPFAAVPAADPFALAAEIVRLAGDVATRQRFAETAHRFYVSELSNRQAFAKLQMCLLAGGWEGNCGTVVHG